jgi:hypothetical protein
MSFLGRRRPRTCVRTRPLSDSRPRATFGYVTSRVVGRPAQNKRGRERERPDVHAGPRSLRSTLTVLPSRTSRSFPSRASQPTPRRRSWSGSLVPCLNLLSVVTPCSSRYCQIARAASPISASMLQLSPSLPQPSPARTHSRLVTNPLRSRQARWAVKASAPRTLRVGILRRDIPRTERSLSEWPQVHIPEHLSFVQIRQSPPSPSPANTSSPSRDTSSSRW